MSKLRILLADDHTILREGLMLLVNAQSDMEVVAQADNGRDALRLARELAPHVAVLDVSMPGGGAEAAERLRAVCPQVPVLALTRHADQGYLRQLLRAGAKGYVLKKTAADALIHAIRTVAAGGTYIDPSLAAGLVERAIGVGRGDDVAAGGGRLTDREAEVLKLVAWGHSNKKAAERLGISVKTVESYKAGAVEKLQLRSRSDILHYALSQGWLTTDSEPE